MIDRVSVTIAFCALAIGFLSQEQYGSVLALVALWMVYIRKGPK